MNYYWDKPIIVQDSAGKLVIIRSVMEAAAFVLEEWPREPNEDMLKPLEKFINVIEEGACPEEARSQFLLAIHKTSRLHS